MAGVLSSHAVTIYAKAKVVAFMATATKSVANATAKGG